MIILSHGFKQPQTGDFGDVFFPALEDNIQLLNDHTHDGVNSEKVSGLSLTSSSLTVLAASFVDQGDTTFRSTVTVPLSNLVDNYVITVKDPTTKEIIYLKSQKLNATQFYLFTNTVQDFEVIFGV